MQSCERGIVRGCFLPLSTPVFCRNQHIEVTMRPSGGRETRGEPPSLLSLLVFSSEEEREKEVRGESA